MNGWTPLHLERKVKRGETSYIIKFHSMTCMCVCVVQYGLGLRFLKFFPCYICLVTTPSLSPSPLSLPLPPTYAGIVLFYKESAGVYTYYRCMTTVLGVLSFSFVRGQALLLNYTLLTFNPAIAIYS